MRVVLLAIILIGGLPLGAMSQTNNPSTKNPAEMMREMRLKILNPASQMSLKPSKDYPRVATVLMDWPMGTNVISVYGACTGDASIYTTATFGVMGGVGHEPVRQAAHDLVKIGEKHCDAAVSTKDFPYPKPGHIYFYLVCYDDVRKIEVDEDLLKNGTSKYSNLGAAAQKLIGELRQIVQKND